MKITLNLSADGRVLSAGRYANPPEGAVMVDKALLPAGDLTAYRYVDGVFVHDPLPVDQEHIDTLKREKIDLSKAMLSEYIKEHPLTSTAHGGIAGIYSVTEEKQSLMTSQYISYQAEKQFNPDAVLTWNETGKSCEVWTEEEFLQLIVEIRQYVYPLVYYQQTIEEQINAATSIQEVEAIVIDYSKV